MLRYIHTACSADCIILPYLDGPYGKKWLCHTTYWYITTDDLVVVRRLGCMSFLAATSNIDAIWNHLPSELDPCLVLTEKAESSFAYRAPPKIFARGLSSTLSPKRNVLLIGYWLPCSNARRLAQSMKHTTPSVALATTVTILNSFIYIYIYIYIYIHTHTHTHSNCFLAFTFSLVIYCTTPVSISGLRIEIPTQHLLNAKHECNAEHQRKWTWISLSMRWRRDKLTARWHLTTLSYSGRLTIRIAAFCQTNVWCGTWLRCFRAIVHAINCYGNITSLNMDKVWDGSNWVKPKYWKKNMSQWHLVHHKFNIDWPGIKPRASVVINRLSHGSA